MTSCRPDAETKKAIICLLLMAINSSKLQEYHLVSYLSQCIKWHPKGLKESDHLQKVVSLPFLH